MGQLHKSNLFNNLLHRGHQICSFFTLLHREFNQIFLVLEKSGCPQSCLHRHINQFWENTAEKTAPKGIIFTTLEFTKNLCGYHLFVKFHCK